MAQNKKVKNRNIVIIIGLILGVPILIGILGSGGMNIQTNTQQEEPKTENQQNNNNKNNSTMTEAKDLFTEAMRKCSVMEAFDIRVTGIGVETNNAFNDGRKLCESLVKETYDNNKDEFIKDIDTDWSNRSNEKIDGKDMIYYLSILGW
jgi:hypothetical protein